MITFDKPGKENTGRTLELALEKGRTLGIKYFVVASNTGETALELQKISEPPVEIVVVSHHVGFKEPGYDEMSQETREKLDDLGLKVLTTTHLFANVERAITSQFGGLYPGGIISATLRCFGQGVKVCFEISTMALDAGLIPYGEDVIAIGGAGRGADTAAVISPAHGKDFFKTRVREIICMPRGK